jgi:hypothetical protein
MQLNPQQFPASRGFETMKPDPTNPMLGTGFV